MNKKELKQWIKKLIEEDKLYKFYKSKAWIGIKEKVLKENHYECAWCRENGKISRAETVHHVQFVKKHPELALSEWYTFGGVRYKNLIPLCHDCHDKAHERFAHQKKKQFNEERW